MYSMYFQGMVQFHFLLVNIFLASVLSMYLKTNANVNVVSVTANSASYSYLENYNSRICMP